MSSEIKELNVVTLKEDYKHIKKGTKGTVVHLHRDNSTAEVEFNEVVTISVSLLEKE